MDLGLTGQVAVVTGAAGGIGLETVKVLISVGCSVVCHVNKNTAPLDTYMQECDDATKKKLLVVKADARDEAAVEKLYQDAGKQFGKPVQLLVANHGVMPEMMSIADTPLEKFREVIDINLTGYFLFCKHFLRCPFLLSPATLSLLHLYRFALHLGQFHNVHSYDRSRFPKRLTMWPARLPTTTQTHTSSVTSQCVHRQIPKEAINSLDNYSIVLITSTAGKFGERGQGAYAASKSATMYGFMRTLKNEIVQLAPRGRVNVVQPGWVATPLAAPYIEAKEHHKALQTMPLKKVASTVDCANAITGLLSPVMSGHCSGTIIEVDGGMEGRVLNQLADLEGC
eukprot:TRINITY_DN44708_c0_g1_i2.p1 TRINITY_DN44708_c0_g1~~TRINITY_DN44708_c0_g1_i2.p1  ORF type:complete len:348 (+),score=21.06 TRINITY_DN44708_c0_g1_i2:25-1044(+)